jgi:CheY-like chemotaxis protein
MNKPLSVLAVDDDNGVLHSIQAGLRSTNWLVATESDVKRALERAEQLRPDVILCDAAMPEISGQQVIVLLKNHRRTAHIPVVLMSVYDLPSRSNGAWPILQKPFGAKQLLDVIARVTGLTGERSLAA